MKSCWIAISSWFTSHHITLNHHSWSPLLFLSHLLHSIILHLSTPLIIFLFFHFDHITQCKFFLCEVASVHLLIVCGIISVWNDEHWWGEVQVWLQVELEDDYENDFKNWTLLFQSKVKLDAHIRHGKFNQVVE